MVMYNVGDVVFYYSTGVCEVVNIGEPAIEGLSHNISYYTLKPLSKNHREMIYVPTNTKAFMRYAINAEQAQKYISMIENIEPEYPETRNPKGVQDFYSNLLGTYDNINLLKVIVSLTLKKRQCADKNKHLNQTQSSFLRRAQEIVYNEFAWALDKTSDEIANIIDSKIL